MSGKKDQAVVVVIDGLTATQAGRLKGAISTQKVKLLPKQEVWLFQVIEKI